MQISKCCYVFHTNIRALSNLLIIMLRNMVTGDNSWLCPKLDLHRFGRVDAFCTFKVQPKLFIQHMAVFGVFPLQFRLVNVIMKQIRLFTINSYQLFGHLLSKLNFVWEILSKVKCVWATHFLYLIWTNRCNSVCLCWLCWYGPER